MILEQTLASTRARNRSHATILLSVLAFLLVTWFGVLLKTHDLSLRGLTIGLAIGLVLAAPFALPAWRCLARARAPEKELSRRSFRLVLADGHLEYQLTKPSGVKSLLRVSVANIKTLRLKGPYLFIKTGLLTERRVDISYFEEAQLRNLLHEAARFGPRVDIEDAYPTRLR